MSRSKTVLVVDDEPGLVEMLRTGLELAGFGVLSALDGPTALYKLRSENPALVILDIAMPGMSGWGVLERIESDPATAGTPVIMLTARTMDEDAMRGLEMGAIDYITKPFDLRHLISVVRLVAEKLDNRGREAYRQEVIAQHRRLMHTRNHLFPSGSNG